MRDKQSRLKQLLVIPVGLCVLASGIPRVSAGELGGASDPPGILGAASKIGLPSVPTVADYARMREAANRLRENGTPRLKEDAARLIRWIDIATAKTREERHVAIARLDVKIIESTPGDGRRGKLKTFIAGGKARLQLFIPSATPSSADEPSESTPRGPSAVTYTGRWKSDGNGGCYWDDNDGGPDQCSPVAGRFKSGGNGECYYDPNDSGPNQCTPLDGRWESDGNGGCQWNPYANGASQCQPPGCYYQGQPDTCVTQQELDDLASQIVSAQDDLSVMQSEYDASYAEYEAYCNEHPNDCDLDNFRPGPSVLAGCANEAVNAVAGIATAYGTTYFTWEGLASGAIATTGAAIASGILVGAAVIIAGWTAWQWYQCMHPKVIGGDAAMDFVSLFEPVESVGGFDTRR